MTTSKVRLDENYSRGLVSRLSYLDRLLTELRSILTSRSPSLFHRPVNHPSEETLQAVEVHLREIEAGLDRVRNELHLELEVKDNVVRKGAAVLNEIWAILCDTETHTLKGYGPPPEGLKEALDPIVKKLQKAALAAEKILTKSMGKP